MIISKKVEDPEHPLTTKEDIIRVTVSLNSDIFNQLPSHHRDTWIREAIAEKLE